MRPADTDPAARAAQIAAYRAMTPAQRVREAVAMSEAARAVAESGARHRAREQAPTARPNALDR